MCLLSGQSHRNWQLCWQSRTSSRFRRCRTQAWFQAHKNVINRRERRAIESRGGNLRVVPSSGTVDGWRRGTYREQRVGRGWAPPCLAPGRGPAPSQSTAWWGWAAPARPQAWPAGRAEAHQVPRGHCWGREAPARPRSGTATGPRRPRLGRVAPGVQRRPLMGRLWIWRQWWRSAKWKKLIG